MTTAIATEPVTSKILWRHDIVLIGIMATLAACGLIYEYLLAHYAGRILGAVETTIYAMIGVMIVAMGLGAFLAKWVRCPFKGFAWLEVVVGLIGGTAVLIMASLLALTYLIPTWLQSIYGLHPSIAMDGGLIAALQNMVAFMPFVCGFVIGVFIGMEIPLIARIRESVYERHLKHNTGTIYGADYIGAGVGAAIWITFCLQVPILVAAVGTAAVNVIAGLIFLWRYGDKIKGVSTLWGAQFLLALLLVVTAIAGPAWMQDMNNVLFKDQVVHTKITPYQHLSITKRRIGRGIPEVYSLYINGRLQFSSNDEQVYHSMLTYPVLAASARQGKVLVIGGGDGLAVRDILNWDPHSVTLVELDGDMIALFSGQDTKAPKKISQVLTALNENALNDKRVSIIIADAFIETEKMVARGRKFDAIIVDLPDPSHPDLNKLYSDFFYAQLKELLSADGAIGIQSTSPYHAKKAFISIGKSLAKAGYVTEQYHQNVPSFGEWGWTIGVPMGKPASERIQALEKLPVPDKWVSKDLMLAAFVFSPSFYADAAQVEANTLGSRRVYRYHHEAWQKQDGAFLISTVSP